MNHSQSLLIIPFLVANFHFFSVTIGQSSNVSYHGELEKKAAMEQKRTLTGDEANGQETTAGIYNNNSSYLQNNVRLRRKIKNRPPRNPQKNILTQINKLTAAEHMKHKSYKPCLAIVRPLNIPQVFIAKPFPPVVSYRTGKVWSRKKPSDLLQKSPSDTDLVGNQEPPVPDNILPKDLVSISNDIVHNRSRRREIPCLNCLIDVGYVSYVTRDRLSVDRTLHSLLDDFLYSSNIQHVLFSIC